jgi:hypothetical protein
VLRHIDGDRFDNRLNNLQTLTPQQYAAVRLTVRRRIPFQNQLPAGFNRRDNETPANVQMRIIRICVKHHYQNTIILINKERRAKTQSSFVVM